MAGVPLHDVWAVDVPPARSGVTLDEFLRAAGSRMHRPSRVVRGLLGLRFFIGRFFGWDDAAAERSARSFADRLTAADRAASLVPPGTKDGPFRVVYRLPGEQLAELINKTAHAAALSALVETAAGYRFYFAVYVEPVSRLTPVYLALIDPFRKLVVYPSLLRGIRANWERTISAVPAEAPR